MQWDNYYKIKTGQAPCPIVAKALNLFQSQGKAIDLGCGAGNEAVLLLNSGWDVWAIDGDANAIETVKNRNDIKGPRKLVASLGKFEDESTWSTLPDVDLIYAANSLPFCKHSEFKKVWTYIKQHIMPGGRFAGHFFGLLSQDFPDQAIRKTIFLKKEEIVCLLQEFDIEYFQEVEEVLEKCTGQLIRFHVFEVIARKAS